MYLFELEAPDGTKFKTVSFKEGYAIRKPHDHPEIQCHRHEHVQGDKPLDEHILEDRTHRHEIFSRFLLI